MQSQVSVSRAGLVAPSIWLYAIINGRGHLFSLSVMLGLKLF